MNAINQSTNTKEKMHGFQSKIRGQLQFQPSGRRRQDVQAERARVRVLEEPQLRLAAGHAAHLDGDVFAAGARERVDRVRVVGRHAQLPVPLRDVREAVARGLLVDAAAEPRELDVGGVERGLDLALLVGVEEDERARLAAVARRDVEVEHRRDRRRHLAVGGRPVGRVRAGAVDRHDQVRRLPLLGELAGACARTRHRAGLGGDPSGDFGYPPR